MSSVASTAVRSALWRYAWMLLAVVAATAFIGAVAGLVREAERPGSLVYDVGSITYGRAHLDGRWVILFLGITALMCFLLYLRSTHYAHFLQRNKLSHSAPAAMDWADVLERAKGYSPTIEEARLFWRAIANPREVFARISEEAETYTRSTRIRTTFTIRVNQGLRMSMTVPVILAAGEEVSSGLALIGPEGKRLSTLSHRDAMAFVAATVFRLMKSGGYRARWAYQRQSPEIERRIAKYLSSCAALGGPSSGSSGEDDAIQLLGDVNGLLGMPNEGLDMATDVLAALYGVHPICVRIPLDGAEAEPTIRCTVERLIITPILEQASGADAVWQLRDLSPYFSRARADLGLASAIAFAVSFIGSLLRERLVRRVRAVFDFARKIFGIRSSHVSLSLENAERSDSYHLQVKGPEGHYLARQEVVDRQGLDSLASPPFHLAARSVAAVRPLGQRHAHLYVRGGRSDGRNEYYRAAFFERPPGSTGLAALSASSAALIVWILAAKYGHHSAASKSDPSGMLQILMAFPLAASSYTISAPLRSAVGGVLAARVVAGLVALLSVFAVAASLLPKVFYTYSLEVVTAILGVIAVGAIGSWLQRTATYQKFSSSGKD